MTETHRIDPCQHCDAKTWRHCFRNGCAAYCETSARRLAAKEEFDRHEPRMTDRTTDAPQGARTDQGTELTLVPHSDKPDRDGDVIKPGAWIDIPIRDPKG